MIRILKVPECFKILRRYVKPEQRTEFDALFHHVEQWINVRDEAVCSMCDDGDSEYITELLGTVRVVLGEIINQLDLLGDTAVFVMDTMVIMESDTDLLTTHLITDLHPEASVWLRFTPAINVAYRRTLEANGGSEAACNKMMHEWVMRLLEAMGTSKEDEPMYSELGEVERGQCWAWGEYFEYFQTMIPNNNYEMTLSGWSPNGVTLTFKRV